MKTQVDIPCDINKKLIIFRIQGDFKDKEDAIIEILKEKLNENGMEQLQ